MPCDNTLAHSLYKSNACYKILNNLSFLPQICTSQKEIQFFHCTPSRIIPSILISNCFPSEFIRKKKYQWDRLSTTLNRYVVKFYLFLLEQIIHIFTMMDVVKQS